MGEDLVPDDIIIPILLVIFITFLIWIALSAVLKSKTKSGFITTIGLLLFFFYGHIYILLDELQNDVDLSHFFLLIPLLILFGFGSYYFIKTKRLLDNATVIVNVVVISLVLISFTSVVEFFIAENYVNETSEDSFENPIQVANAENLPDIYYIIPDSYAGQKTLQIFDFTNSEFIDFLTKKGFYVSSESYSNYQYSSLSITSTLNMNYVHYLFEGKADKMEEMVEERLELAKMGANAEVFQFLKSKGYTNFFIEGIIISGRNSEFVDFRLCTKGENLKEFDILLIRTTMLLPIYVELISGDVRDFRLCGFN